jgi:hypothetical protein
MLVDFLNGPHDITSQKIELFITTAVRTSVPTWWKVATVLGDASIFMVPKNCTCKMEALLCSFKTLVDVYQITVSLVLELRLRGA